MKKVAAIILAESHRKWAPEDVKNFLSVTNKMGATIVYQNGDFRTRDLEYVRGMLAMEEMTRPLDKS